MKIGKRIIRSLALALFAGASLQAAPITEGQWLQLNFSNGFNPPDKDNFNFFNNPADGLSINDTTGTSSTMIDSQANTVDASLTVSGFGGANWEIGNDSWSGLGTSTPAPGTSIWSENEIRNFWWANNTTPVLTLDGLDESLAYNVYIYSKINGGQMGEVTTVDINGTSQDMASRADRFLDGDEDLLFQDVILDESGNLVITILNGPGSLQYNPVINSIVIEATERLDPILVLDSGTYDFGTVYNPSGTDSTTQTITYRNAGYAEDITIDSIALTDDASGLFTITAAPANGTVVPADGTFDVQITATGGSGYTEYTGSLDINVSHSGTTPDQDRTETVNAVVVADGDNFIIVDNPKLNSSLAGWNGGALATQGLVSENGARVRGAGDPDSDNAINNLSQAFNYWLSPDFDLSLYFAIPDWAEFGAAADGANYDRAFQLAVQGTPLTPGSVDFDDGDTQDTIINLFYFPDGAGGSASEGFYLYDGVASNFTHLAGLGTVTASTGIGTNAFPSNLVVYQLTINGRDFGTPTAAYDISISNPNATTIAATVSGLTTYHGVNPVDATAQAVVLSTSDKAGSDTNPSDALQSSFWVDDVEVALLETVPLALFHQATPPGAPKTLVGGIRTLDFTVQNVGLGSDLEITSATLGTSGFSMVGLTLPITIATGTQTEFTVSGTSTDLGLTADTVTFAASDTVAPAPAVDVGITGFKSSTVVLVDYDDGVANGIHEASINNGGLEEGAVGTTAGDTPGWYLSSGPGSDADDGTPFVYGTAPATGAKHGRISGWQAPGIGYGAGVRFAADQWTLEEGDTFTVELKWRGDTGYVLGNPLHFYMHGITVYEENLARFGSVNEAATGDNTSTYETFTYTSDPIPAGSPLIGKGFELEFSLTAPRDHWYLIDDVSVTANFQAEGMVSTNLEITGIGFEPSSQEVTLSWYNTDAGAAAYTIKSISDLVVPGVTNEFTLDGTEDYSALPGSIQYKFIDPDATGSSKFYWIIQD